ncbi:hypothetical protein ILYODFUR_021053 [Ilyodon furcidens]|uniref:Secreted protein n=1 Tax=Ilyodon furcidens TaxID=33524 RepID=A0ABV0UXS2_9TELE
MVLSFSYSSSLLVLTSFPIPGEEKHDAGIICHSENDAFKQMCSVVVSSHRPLCMKELQQPVLFSFLHHTLNVFYFPTMPFFWRGGTTVVLSTSAAALCSFPGGTKGFLAISD